jgi:hypothetical protein
MSMPLALNISTFSQLMLIQGIRKKTIARTKIARTINLNILPPSP